MSIIQSCRHFLVGLSAASAAGAGLFKVQPASAGDLPPETTTVRLGKWGAYCWASVFLAGELLRADGITDVHYVTGDTSVDNSQWLARGDTDFDMNMPSMHITSLEAGVPIKVLAGVHFGCFELMANDSVRSVTDLRGKRVGVWVLDSHPHKLTSLIADYVGLDPINDIEWVEAGQTPAYQVYRRKNRCIPRRYARTADPARPEGLSRPYGRQHRRRQSLVAVLLLHGRRQRRLCEQIPGQRPSVSCAPSSRPPTSVRRTRK